MKKTDLKPMITLTCFAIICFALIFTACNPSEKKQEETSAVQSATMEESGKEDTSEIKTDAEDEGQVPLTITVKNLKTTKDVVWITFYKEEHEFLSLTDILKTYKLNPDGNTLVAEIEDLEFGEYAIATFQDLNNNGKIDKKVVMPTEPYGFSNNYKPTIRAPRFSNCKFTYSKEKHDLSISMIWK